MKQYDVWYTLKMNNHGYVKHVCVKAESKKEAFAMAEVEVQKLFNRHAFHKTLKPPVWKDGAAPSDLERCELDFNGATWTRAYKYGKQIVLW